jgi:hypothetical protein
MIKNNNIMRTYKLTPLDQLKLEEKQLREEIKISEQKMVFQLQYINDNWGSMLLKSVTSSIMNKVTDRVESSSPLSTSSYLTRSVGGGWGNLLLSNYKSVGSIGWRLLKPIALTFITKRATARLFHRKKR